jgi:hypothetical protein
MLPEPESSGVLPLTKYLRAELRFGQQADTRLRRRKKAK